MGNGLRGVGSGLLLIVVTLVGVVALERSTIPAERIDFNYSLLGFNIQVQDLATFAETGEVSDSLNYYFRYIPDKQSKQLRKFLRQSYDVDPVLVYRYSRTSAGVKMLQRIGEIIQLPGYINGFSGLRAAVVQTAQSSEGINFVDFLQRFPTDIKLNLGELLQLVKQVDQAEEDTQEFIASLSKKEVVPKNIQKNNKFRDLSQPGNYQVTKQTLKFYDRQRDRNLVTDLYLPQNKTGNIPMIVVSNGLGAKRDRFEELAGYLTSRGFGVVIPDHPGSDRNRQKAFVEGLYRENFDATEFINRPLDISYILDRLEQLNRDRFDHQLNLKQVGFFGYSIGGTTGLSLAGAEFDFTQLEQDCAQPLNLLNISILYQCRALELPRDRPSLKDDRIKAAYMFVPFGHSIFGRQKQDKISIPIMFQVVDQDFLTSLLEEQVPLFNSLGKDSYLVISEKLPHSNVTLSKETQLSQAKTSQVAKTYQNLLSLVFFQSYIAEDPSYIPYLSTAYLQAIAQKPYNLHLLAN
ncbi:MAG: alpha/beta hydrolase [Pleurocapsa sp. CRU_1_2]|nr:alpha/beta hydrolase [Pleurocapsa sp. CRU_1_2]